MTGSELPRKTPLSLIASVLLNLLLIGFVAGHLLRPKPDLHRAERMHRAFESREDAQRFIGLLRANREAAAEELAAQRAAEKALFETLRAEPYDAARVRAQFEALRLAESNAKTVLHNDLSERLSTLGPQERARLADMAAHARDRAERRRHKR